MKKIKILAVIIILLSIIFGIFGIFNSVRAVSSSDFHTESAPRPTGSTYTASANYLEVVWDNVYCLQYGDSLKDSSMTFTVAEFVEIRGNKAYFYDSDGNLENTTSSSRNNKLAGILSTDAFSGDDSWTYGMHLDYNGAVYSSSSIDRVYSKAQLGLWYIMTMNEGWNGYSNSNGTNPTWSVKGPSNNSVGEMAYEEVNTMHGEYEVKYNVDIYHLTSGSYQDLLLVYPQGSDGGDGGSTPVPELTDYTILKEWWYDEGSNMQPSAINVTLYGNGAEVETVTLNSSNSVVLTYKSIYPDYYTDECSDVWEYTFYNLPLKDSSGNIITYTVKESVANEEEQDKFDEYMQSGYGGDGYYAFYNELQTSISVKKEWDDNNNQEGKRPTSITVQLLENGEEYTNEDVTTTLTLNASNNWTGEFSGLPRYLDGEKANYTVKEIAVDGYTTTISGDADSGFTITNTYVPEIDDTTSVNVTKKWDDNSNAEGKRPESITITLMANGATYKTATLTGTTDTWTYTFTDLPIEIDGVTATYTVEEATVDGYTSNVSGDANTGFVITNKKNGKVLEEVIITNTHTPEKININVTKKWEDESNANKLRPSSITVNLMANGTQVATATLSGTGNEWTHTFENLYKYEAGKEIQYTIEEIAVEGYTTEITGNQTDGFVITNTEQKRYIDITGTVWLDGNGGKSNAINGVFVDNTDKGLSGILVRLCDKDGNSISETYSNEYGNYTIRVENRDLAGAYVEFEYDGMLYTTVAPNVKTYIDGEQTIEAKSAQQSKAVEDEVARNTYDKDFQKVTSSNIDDVQEVIKNMKITASTEGIISFDEGFTDSTAEDGTKIKVMENVNLGLFEREQPDVAIFSDLSSVKVVMNNQEYTYLYGVRSNKYSPEDANYLQVKFQNKDTYIYKRPVNPADIAYVQNHQDAMTVEVTYEIRLANLSKTLPITVYNIKNYYDKQYTLNISDWTIDTTGTQFNQATYNGNEIMLQPGTESSPMTLTYTISSSAIIGLLGGNATLNNAVEIESYSTTYGETTLYAGQRTHNQDVQNGNEENARGGNNYAGYDYNSQPGNAGMFINAEGRLEAEKLEDDTDIAPSFVLCKANNPKTLSGTVFEDTDVRANEERVGDGQHNAGEKSVQNVTVKLYEEKGDGTFELATLYDESGNEIIDGAIQSTDETNGEYAFKGVVTGKKYYIEFTYGNATTPSTRIIGDDTRPNVNARDYKSTIITEPTLYEIFKGRTSDMYWYMNIADNHSVAIDDMNLRLGIEDLQYSNFDTGINMTAESKPFITKLEFDNENKGQSDMDGNITSNGNEISNNLSKLDFGIIERPREDLFTQKTITNIKLTLANGQILTQGNPSDSNADISYVKSMGFSRPITSGKEARAALEKQLLIELDSELIQGAQLEIQYQVTVTNNNEIDYDYGVNTNYYYYGEIDDGVNPIKTKIDFIDYMDSDITYVETENTDWKIVENIESYKDTLICQDAYNAVNNGEYKALQGASGTSVTLARTETSTPLKMTVRKLLASKDENVYDNGVEIIKIDGKTARTIQFYDKNNDGTEEIAEKTYEPGNYVPSQGREELEQDDDKVKVIITPPTGITKYIITYGITVLAGLVIIVVGIIFIKKKVLTM